MKQPRSAPPFAQKAGYRPLRGKTRAQLAEEIRRQRRRTKAVLAKAVRVREERDKAFDGAHWLSLERERLTLALEDARAEADAARLELHAAREVIGTFKTDVAILKAQAEGNARLVELAKAYIEDLEHFLPPWEPALDEDGVGAPQVVRYRRAEKSGPAFHAALAAGKDEPVRDGLSGRPIG